MKTARNPCQQHGDQRDGHDSHDDRLGRPVEPGHLRHRYGGDGQDESRERDPGPLTDPLGDQHAQSGRGNDDYVGGEGDGVGHV